MRHTRRFRSLLATLALPLAACVEVLGPDAEVLDDPCAARFVSIGSTIAGSLERFDCLTLDDTESFVDYYELALHEATEVSFYLESLDFDAYLMVFDEWDELVVEDDDSGESSDAWISVKLPAGRYYIAATSFDTGETGNYRLFVE